MRSFHRLDIRTIDRDDQNDRNDHNDRNDQNDHLDQQVAEAKAEPGKFTVLYYYK